MTALCCQQSQAQIAGHSFPLAASFLCWLVAASCLADSLIMGVADVDDQARGASNLFVDGIVAVDCVDDCRYPFYISYSRLQLRLEA